MAQAPSQPVEIQPEWPTGPCIKNKVYVMDTPHDQRIIVMSEESWGEFGTLLQTLREVAKNQNQRILELVAESRASAVLLADAKERLEALRDVRRKEMRPEVEAQFNLKG